MKSGGLGFRWFLLLLVAVLPGILAIVGCQTEVGHNPDIPVKSAADAEGGGTAVNLPITVADASGLISIVYILSISAICFAVLAVLFAALWRRGSKKKRKKA